MRTTTDSSCPPAQLLEGVSLEQHTGVCTAIAEGLPLEAILSHEQIAPEVWPRADIAWKMRLADDGTAGPLFAEMCRKRVVAEEALARATTPIDTALEPWLAFLRAYGAHPSPFELLQEAGLNLNDLSRLQRSWARRMAEDEGLRKRADELAKKELAPLPPIRVEPAALRPFPWSPGPKPAPVPEVPKIPVPAETSLAPGKVRFYSYIAVKAQIAEHPEDEERVLRELGLKDFAATDAGWQEILRGDAELARDYRHLFDTQRARLRAAKKNAATVHASPSARTEPLRPAVPTAASPSAFQPLPVEPSAQTSAAPPASLPVPVRAPAALSGTSLELDIPRGPALPFVQGAPASLPPVPPASAAPAMPQVAPKSSLGGTSLALDVPRDPVLPFQVASDPPRASPDDASPPALTLEQHASLTLEIAVAPEREREALARYYVTPAAKAAADHYYARRFAEDPGVRAAWDRAYQTYGTWWMASRVSR